MGQRECIYSKLAAPSNYTGIKAVSQGVIRMPKPTRPSFPTTFNFCRCKRHISCSAINLSDYRMQGVLAGFGWEHREWGEGLISNEFTRFGLMLGCGW